MPKKQIYTKHIVLNNMVRRFQKKWEILVRVPVIRALTLFAARVLRATLPSDEKRPGIRVKAAAV